MSSEKERLESAKQMVCDLLKIIKDIHCSSMMRLSLIGKENEESYFENENLTYNLKDAMDSIDVVNKAIDSSIVSCEVLSRKNNIGSIESINILDVNTFLNDNVMEHEKHLWKLYFKNQCANLLKKDVFLGKDFYFQELSSVMIHKGESVTRTRPNPHYFDENSPISLTLLFIVDPVGNYYRIIDEKGILREM